MPIDKQLVYVYNQSLCSVLAVQDVSHEQTRQYGVVAGNSLSDRLTKVTHMVEKPAPEVTSSDLAMAG